jgi:hypothetical protein
MKQKLLAIGLFAFSPSLPHCEPDEAPPPAVAQNAPPPAPPPAEEVAAAAAPAASAAPAYASQEYTVGADPDSYDDDDPAALTDFHGALDAHGAWVDDPKYGTVWAPAPAEVGADFQPYVSAGHWAYDDDWVWVSDYPWGWAPFHYGRWMLAEGRGWVWIPGRAYRGAWVEWGVDDGFGYVGWAPMPPAFFWFGGGAILWRGPAFGPRWSYCARADIFAPAVGARVVVGPAVVPIGARMHVYSAPGAAPGAGPPIERLGYTAAQVPHSTGAAGVAQARQFARPSTAQALGAHPPSAAIRTQAVAPGRAAGTAPAGAAGRAGGTARPTAQPANGARPNPSRGGGAPRGPSFHGGGGHHR